MSESMKMQLQRVFVYSVYNHLRNTAPKDYPTTGEIKETISAILPALKEHVVGYLDILSKAEPLRERLVKKEITEKEALPEFDKINAELKEYNIEHGTEICDIVIDEEGFKTLKAQFDRENWGTDWTSNLEEYAEMEAAFAAVGK